MVTRSGRHYSRRVEKGTFRKAGRKMSFRTDRSGVIHAWYGGMKWGFIIPAEINGAGDWNDASFRSEEGSASQQFDDLKDARKWLREKVESEINDPKNSWRNYHSGRPIRNRRMRKQTREMVGNDYPMHDADVTRIFGDLHECWVSMSLIADKLARAREQEFSSRVADIADAILDVSNDYGEQFV